MLRHRVERARHCRRWATRAQRGGYPRAAVAALSASARSSASGRGAARYRGYSCAAPRRAPRSQSGGHRCRCGAGVPSPRVRGRAPHTGRRDALLWRSRRTLGRPQSRARLLRRFPQALEAPPPAEVRRAIEDILALLRGERRDLSQVAIDVAAVPEFHRRVYEVARRIPAGETLSYGEVAERLGDRNL